MSYLKKVLKNKTGSALVGVLALSIIMSIGALGYSGVTRNTISHEYQALEDSRALLAAEAGLLIGTAWLKHQSNWDQAIEGSGITNLLSSLSPEQKKVYPDFDVEIDLQISNDSIKVISTATSDLLPYLKQLSWILTEDDIPSGAYGYFVNDAYTATGNFKGLRSETFTGPFHSNMPLWLFNPTTGNEVSNKVKFNGPVTVYNKAPNDFQGKYGIGRNNYDSGIKSEVANTAEQLDQVFLDSYNSNGPKLDVHFDPSGIQVNVLQASATNTLSFGVDNGIPFYTYDGTKHIYSATQPLIIRANSFDLTVKEGTMKGNVTVMTDPGKKITIDLNQGSLKYDGVSLTTNDGAHNYGVDTDDLLAFYSGSVIDLSVSNQGGAKAPVLTAQLVAASANGTINATGVNKTEFTIIGSISINKWWDPPHGVNEPTVRLLHDRRAKAAPGLSIVELNDDGSIVNTMSKCNYTEKNIPKS